MSFIDDEDNYSLENDLDEAFLKFCEEFNYKESDFVEPCYDYNRDTKSWIHVRKCSEYHKLVIVTNIIFDKKTHPKKAHIDCVCNWETRTYSNYWIFGSSDKLKSNEVKATYKLDYVDE